MEDHTQAEHRLSDVAGVSRFVFRVVAHFTEPQLFGGDGPTGILVIARI
jgi:hypothetical protein